MPTPSCCWLLCRHMPVLTNLRLAARYTYVYAHHPAVGYVECKISLLGSTAQTGRLSPPGDYWLSGPDAMQAGAAGEDCLPVSAASERIRCPETIMSPVLLHSKYPHQTILGCMYRVMALGRDIPALTGLIVLSVTMCQRALARAGQGYVSYVVIAIMTETHPRRRCLTGSASSKTPLSGGKRKAMWCSLERSFCFVVFLI